MHIKREWEKGEINYIFVNFFIASQHKVKINSALNNTKRAKYSLWQKTCGLTEVVVLVLFRSVEFETRDDMLDCIRKADNTELGGKKIRLTEVSTCIC